MAAGQKITIDAVAKAAGVSPATVSRAMRHPEMVNAATLQRVNDAMRELGYASVAERASMGSNSKVIVVNIPWLDNPFYSEIVRGVRVAADTRGVDVVISWEIPTAETIGRFCTMLRRCNAGGVITLSPLSLEALAQIEAAVPLVQCCECNEGAAAPFVTIDDRAAARTAVEHLISCGCQRLSIVGGPESFKYARGRMEGFLATLAEHGLEARSGWTLEVPHNNYGLAYSAICHMLDSEAVPDGVFACSDTYATAAINAARTSGLQVPRDLKVVGFDNTSTAVMASPTLTTINQPRYQMGYLACNMLLERMGGNTPTTRSMYLATELIVRESTASGA